MADTLQLQRLRTLLRVAEEIPEDNKFTVQFYAHPCGTPACIGGHYAARSDVQDELTLQQGMHNITVVCRHGPLAGKHVPLQCLKQHFQLTLLETLRLFSADGCNAAQTPAEAAAYIRRFICCKEDGVDTAVLDPAEDA